MKKQYVKIGDKLYPRISDVALIGSWEEVKEIDAQSIKPELSPAKLDGLIIRGYEMKWDVTNENYERYEKTAFDDFIKSYFVERGLNMPVDINHNGWGDWKAYCGRVLYIERNSVGFYFVVYIPRDYADYERLRWGLRNGIIQGFSKEGYATDWEWKYTSDGAFDYELIKAMKLLSVSLVCTPANGIAFEKMQDVKNGLQYIVQDIEESPKGKTLRELLNKK